MSLVFKKNPNRPDWPEVFWIFFSPILFFGTLYALGWFAWHILLFSIDLIKHILWGFNL